MLKYLTAAYRKAHAAWVAAGAVFGVAISDGEMTGKEWWEVLAAAVGALGVGTLANKPATE